MIQSKNSTCMTYIVLPGIIIISIFMQTELGVCLFIHTKFVFIPIIFTAARYGVGDFR